MDDNDSRYWVMLRYEGREIASFAMSDLPTLGLQFEIEDRRWQVTNVAALVRHKEVSGEIECDVVQAARFNEQTERWEQAPLRE